MARTSASRVTSPDSDIAWPPAALTWATVSRAASAETSAIATRAPSRAKAKAVARPIPPPPPVINADFPSSNPAIAPSHIDPRQSCHTGSGRAQGGNVWLDVPKRKQPEPDQLLPQFRWCREMDRMDAEGTRGGGVRLDIVDIDGALRLDRKPLDQQREDARVRLDHLDVARDQNSPEPAEKRKALQRRRIGFGRPVGEPVERDAAIAELGQDLDRAGDRASDHLVEAVAIGVDQLGLVGMLGLQQSGAFGKAAAGVLAAVPFMCAHRRKKMLHPRLVAGKQLAVEVPRVPVDQNPAEVEYHDAAPRPCHSSGGLRCGNGASQVEHGS